MNWISVFEADENLSICYAKKKKPETEELNFSSLVLKAFELTNVNLMTLDYEVHVFYLQY